MKFFMGKDAVVYYGDAGAALSGMNQLGNIREVNLELDAAEADVSIRGQWKGTAQGQKNCSAEWEMVKRSENDPAFAFIRNAYINGSPIELAILTAGRGTAGSEGPKGRFTVMGFGRGESLDGEVTTSVSVSLVELDEYLVLNP